MISVDAMYVRSSVADVVQPLLRRMLGELPLGVRYWDGSESGPSGGPRLLMRRQRALRWLMWSPNELGLARAYVSGDIDVDGELIDVLTLMDEILQGEHAPIHSVDRNTRLALVGAALRLGVLGPPPRPPAEEARLSGRRHSLRRDATAIAHHYDVGNDFYELVLGPSMTYSCAYWAEDSYNLQDAQRAKHDLVARKLGLTEGMRVLDVGCGWGGFVLHAAQHYGVHAVGVTLSRAQADYARKRVAEEGLTDSVEIRVQDYREVRDEPYDAISSVGMAEHVGRSMLPTYATDLFALLRPRGRLLNHAIARPPEAGRHSTDPFIRRYVFPDGELEPLSVMISALEGSGFEVRDVQSLREHYGLTLRAWAENLSANAAEAQRLSSAGRVRVWRLYMSACALAFESGRIGVNQVLAVKPGEHGASGMPRTRSFG